MRHLTCNDTQQMVHKISLYFIWRATSIDSDCLAVQFGGITSHISYSSIIMITNSFFSSFAFSLLLDESTDDAFCCF